MHHRNDLEVRVLVLAPTGRDALLLSRTLASANVQAEICSDSSELLEMLGHGAAAAIVAEEALSPNAANDLGKWRRASQPPWSDMPVIVLTLKKRVNALTIQTLGNVACLERPLRPETVVAAVRAALSARMRQYKSRSREETLIRLNGDLEQFAYAAAHDLREPLRNVALSVEMAKAQMEGKLDSDTEALLNSAMRNARKMEAMVKDLLAYSRVLHDDEESWPITNCCEVLAAAVENLAVEIRASSAQITHDELPLVKMDRTHLLQILQNLIGNALKYRGLVEPPQIHIGSAATEKFWKLSVKDNGIGIKPEFHERVFGIFKRLREKEVDGTGIGLALCKRIVEHHGGEIWIDSSVGKQGATFVFTVPAVEGKGNVETIIQH
jgi:signal transduction histidine kinase